MGGQPASPAPTSQAGPVEQQALGTGLAVGPRRAAKHPTHNVGPQAGMVTVVFRSVQGVGPAAFSHWPAWAGQQRCVAHHGSGAHQRPARQQRAGGLRPRLVRPPTVALPGLATELAHAILSCKEGEVGLQSTGAAAGMGCKGSAQAAWLLGWASGIACKCSRQEGGGQAGGRAEQPAGRQRCRRMSCAHRWARDDVLNSLCGLDAASNNLGDASAVLDDGCTALHWARQGRAGGGKMSGSWSAAFSSRSCRPACVHASGVCSAPRAHGCRRWRRRP